MTTIILRDLKTGDDADHARVALEEAGLFVIEMAHDPATRNAHVTVAGSFITAQTIALQQGFRLAVSTLNAVMRRNAGVR